MSVDLLFEVAWKTLLSAGATLVILSLAKSRSAAERSWLAHLGLVATLLLPLTVVTVPEWQVGALDPVANLTSSTGTPLNSEGSVPSEAPSAANPSPAVAGSALDFRDALPWLYAGPAGVLIILLLVAVVRLQFLRRRADVLVEASWATALAAAQRRLGFKHGTALLVSSELRSPISWGVVRPIILLDRRAAADANQAEAIIAHELAHVARLDWAKLLLGRLAVALFWFNPLVWVLARRCHELCEQAVDDVVLRSNIPSAHYVELLIEAARHDNSAILTAANGVAGSGSLTRRVHLVLDPSRSRAAPQGFWMAASCAGALLIATSLSAVAPRQPHSAEADQPLAYAAAPELAPTAQPESASEGLRAGLQPSRDGEREAVTTAAPVVAAPVASDEGSPTTVELLEDIADPRELLAMRRIGIDQHYVDQIRASGYPQLTARQLISMKSVGVTPHHIDDMNALGFGKLTPEQLATTSSVAVTGSYVEDPRRQGFRDLTLSEAVKLKSVGVTGPYVGAIRAAGVAPLNATTVAKLAAIGITPEYVSKLAARGPLPLNAARILSAAASQER